MKMVRLLQILFCSIIGFWLPPAAGDTASEIQAELSKIGTEEFWSDYFALISSNTDYMDGEQLFLAAGVGLSGYVEVSPKEILELFQLSAERGSASALSVIAANHMTDELETSSTDIKLGFINYLELASTNEQEFLDYFNDLQFKYQLVDSRSDVREKHCKDINLELGLSESSTGRILAFWSCTDLVKSESFEDGFLRAHRLAEYGDRLAALSNLHYLYWSYTRDASDETLDLIRTYVYWISESPSQNNYFDNVADAMFSLKAGYMNLPARNQISSALAQKDMTRWKPAPKASVSPSSQKPDWARIFLRAMVSGLQAYTEVRHSQTQSTTANSSQIRPFIAAPAVPIYQPSDLSSANRCECTCVGGAMMNICSSSLAVKQSCYGYCPADNSLKTFELPSITPPPIGTSRCSLASVFNANTGRYERKEVCY